MSLLKAAPPYGALTTQPLTLEELDNHVDANKIWAMVIQLRSEAYEKGYDDGWYHGSRADYDD
jgi:hypothetical protein